MPLNEGDRVTQEKLRKSQEIEQLNLIIEQGKSSERLQANPDWLSFVDKVKKVLEPKEQQRNDTISALAEGAVTRDQRDECLEQIRKHAQEIKDFRYLIDLPERSIQAAEQARKRLSQIKGVK